MTEYIALLRDIVKKATPALLSITEEISAQRPADDKWSYREIIGHLIDSASNNHQRFVRAQLQDHLIFPGYAQEEWVSLQNYQETSWPELIALWQHYNLHIARVMAAIPTARRERLFTKHNLHEIGFRIVSVNSPVTLDFLMEDYVLHLQHHLKQIFGAEYNAIFE